MADEYLYEIPFYWKLQRPVIVLGDWNPAIVDARDNWRKELHDAARFEPARGARTLVDAAGIPDVLCGHHVTWIVGAPASAARYPWLANARLVASNERAAVWRFDGGGGATAGALCPRTPRDGSPRTSGQQ